MAGRLSSGRSASRPAPNELWHRGASMQAAYKSLSVVALLLLVAACSTTAGPRLTERIQIDEAKDSYTISVPVSRLEMTMPKGNWSPKDRSTGGAADNARYFYFADTKEPSLILSGWFEPDRLFTGVREQWEKDTQSWKAGGLPQPVNVSFKRLGGWDTVMYDHDFGNAVSSHLRAHWVQSGTWIDIHLSTTTSRSSAENRRTLISLLRGISVSEKGGG